MGLLRRKSDGLTAELENLRHRKSQLDALLVAAEQRLDEATRDRQAKLLEYDPANDGPPTNAIILRLTDERDACIDALAAVDAKAADVQRRLAEEQDSRRREVASRELTASADALDRVAAEVAAALARVFPALDDVLSKLPLPHLVQKANLKVFSDAVVESLRAQANEAKAYIVRLTSGHAALVPPRPDDVKMPPVPAVERLEILPLQPSKWLEADGSIRTVGAHVTCDPPIEVARAALANGNAINPLSDDAITLRMRVPTCYAYYAAEDCIDLTQPKTAKPPRGLTAAAPAVHSEFVGRPRIGTATVRNSL
jgi:hypothetical protein